MPFLTIFEIDKIDETLHKELEEKIRTRVNGFSAGVIEGRFLFDGFVKPAPANEIQFNGTNIKGSIAFRGIIKGVVKVVASPKEQGKLNKGEILVTAMTTPDFLPCMERAAAFVTDEGGITCHAAIVAREMKKPCVIGTRIATKVLKDGDLVEVDAETGIVKII